MSDLKPIPTWHTQDGQEIKWIDILMVTYERPEFDVEVLNAIRRDTDYLHRVIVVDNGSRSVDHLAKLREEGAIDVLLLLDKNHGLEPAKMFGMPLIRSPLFVNTDNDCLPRPRVNGRCWLTDLVHLMRAHQDYAAIACPPQVFIGANKDDLFRDAGEVVEWDKAGGSLRLMRTDLVRDVGGWRSNPRDAYEASRGEEWHICQKIKALVYKVGYARDIECFHMFGEDEQWGYGDVEHYHRDMHPKPKDSMFISKEDWYAKFDHRT